MGPVTRCLVTMAGKMSACRTCTCAAERRTAPGAGGPRLSSRSTNIWGSLDNAARFKVALPGPIDEIGAILHAASDALLPDIVTPVLVHFDLWEGNIFVDLDYRDHRVLTQWLSSELDAMAK